MNTPATLPGPALALALIALCTQPAAQEPVKPGSADARPPTEENGSLIWCQGLDPLGECKRFVGSAEQCAEIAPCPLEIELLTDAAQASDEQDGTTHGGSLLATVVQSNGNVIEFYADPELEELTLWESGHIARSGPVFDDGDIGKDTSILEAYLDLVPYDAPVPRALAGFSGLASGDLDQMLRGRRLVESVAEPIDIGDHLAALPAAAAGACTVSGGQSLSWGPSSPGHACNVDARVRYMRARICNHSDSGSIRLKLGHKPFSTSNYFHYPWYRNKKAPAGTYRSVHAGCNNCSRLKRRAYYTEWETYYEEASVGGIVNGGSITVNNCD